MKALFLLIFVYVAAGAQTVANTIRVSSEIVPPGGMAQMKVLLTSPKPITTGDMSMDLSAVSFDSIDGIALFDASGDVVGTATVDAGRVNVRFTSPKGTFGSTVDYPILTVALRVSKAVVPGQIFPVSLDPAASFWRDLLGSTLPVELAPGSITVGGSVSITNVVPGGGLLPAGGTFSIFGMGFSPSTKVVVKGPKVSSVSYVSPNELRVTVKTAASMDGAEIILQNPDKSTADYFSYMRGVPVGQSVRSSIARTVPVFSLLTATEAVLAPTNSVLNADYWTALAFQNPAASPATIRMEGRDSAGRVIARGTTLLAPGTRISREVSEFLGLSLPLGGYVHIDSDQPVQALGMLGNDATRVVTPVAVTILAGPPPPVSDPGTSNKNPTGGGSNKP